MKNILILAGAIALGIAGWLLLRPTPQQQSATAAEPGAPIVEVSVPATLSGQAQIGKRGYESVCAECHGANAAGREGMGPPLIHDYYKPNHHADMAFQLAVQNGVRAHHWPFGDMPPQKGFTRADVAAITIYVRELQRANGIN